MPTAENVAAGADFFFFSSYNRERSGSKRQRSSNSSGSRGLMDEGGRDGVMHL